MPTLDTDIQFLKGVGDKRASIYRKLGIGTINDLLGYFPRAYIDLSNPTDISSAQMGESCAIRATVLKKSSEIRLRGGLSLWKVEVSDDTSDMTVTFFNTKYTVESLKIGESYIFYGRLGGTMLSREMNSPTVFSASEADGLWPVYPLTSGITGRTIVNNMREALSALSDSYPDSLPSDIKQRNNLCDVSFALKAIHFPKSQYEADIARNRFIFEELLILSLSLGRLRGGRGRKSSIPIPKPDLDIFRSALPFRLTNAQNRCVEEIIGDLGSGRVMNRLLQGDVGSGKTAVAAASAFSAMSAGYQVAMMAPTEILAAQHFNSLNKLLSPLGYRIELITGSTKSAEKKRVKSALETGETDFVIGTHALLTDDVRFKNLALVITDEQHRFGVAQRAALSGKSETTHTLVMSATPIPRTLSLIIYGDLDLSVIDELPAGRRAIETYRIDSTKRTRAFNYIKSHLDRGLQGYIICPLIEENPDLPSLSPAVEYAERIAANDFKDYSVGLLHGKMKPTEKRDVMDRFYKGEIQLLVATTVVEVGVDVPNAVIMLIESAERFGLGQLHQLRGRIGRGSEKSSCILLTDAKSETAITRLDIMRRTQNGFVIAEQDLKMRGPGDFFGERQHGLPPLRLADLSDDVELLKSAQQEAENILKADPDLKDQRHSGLLKQIDAMYSKIGASPN